MRELLSQADRVFRAQGCCHVPITDCRCQECLRTRFYGGTDYYTCLKCLSYYTMNYGPSYVSEVYHFLSTSQILEIFRGTTLNVLSLGCGFGPDLVALRNYITNCNLPLTLNYRGVDIEPNWQHLRLVGDAALFDTDTALQPFNLAGYDLVIINKLFSTLLANGQSNDFLTHLTSAIPTMPDNTCVMFIDVNVQNRGRDIFDARVAPLFRTTWRYFYPVGGAYTGSYTPINATTNICEIPDGLTVHPKLDVNKTIIFLYRK